MGWTKIVLFFQAIVTLIFGMIFFAQVINLDIENVTEYRIEIQAGNQQEGTPPEYIDIKQRYASAAYILLFVSIIELIIIIKLFT